MQVVAFALAGVSAVMAYGGSAMQAFEARTVPRDQSLRAGLIVRLLRRPLWIGGTLLNIAAFGVQVVALALASLAIVQPTLALGLIVLVGIAKRKLGEKIERRTLVGIAAIIAGLGGLALVAPQRDHLPQTAAMIVVLVCVFAAITGALAALRVLDRSDGLASSIAAGVCYAWLSFSGALLGEAFSRGSSLLIALWGLGTVTAALLAVTAEMSALQAWPVSRSKPVVFVLQTLIPASAAPFFSAHRLGPGRGAAFVLALAIVTGGAVVIATSRAVAETQA